MNIIDLRKKLRRVTEERRKTERRKNPHAFNTDEWIAYLIENNMQVPQVDRRKNERRIDENHFTTDKCEQNIEEREWFEKKYVRIFLTPAERKLLEDVYLSDLD